jgi:hypothetical protein
MPERAGFRIEHDENGRPRAVPNAEDWSRAIPDGVKNGLEALKALISLAGAAGQRLATGKAAEARYSNPTNAQSRPRTEEEWVEVFRSSTPDQVKKHFTDSFRESQEQAMAQAVSTKAAIYECEDKLKRLRREHSRIDAEVDVAASVGDADAGTRLLKQLSDISRNIKHFEELLADAQIGKRVADKTLELNHFQLQEVERELDRWLAMRSAADAARRREGLSRAYATMKRILDQLQEEATRTFADSSAHSDEINGESVMSIDLRDAWATQEFERRRQKQS